MISNLTRSEKEWLIYALVDKAVIVSSDGLGALRCQAIIWTNAELVLIGSLEILYNLKRNTIYIQGNVFENGVSTITTILSPSLRVKSLRPSDAYMRQPINHHWFRQWLVAWPAPSHYLNHCWSIVNWTIRDTLQWNCYRNSNIFIQENAFENVIYEMYEMASILSRPQCVHWQN